MYAVQVFDNEKDALFSQAEALHVDDGGTLDLSTYYQDTRDIWLRVKQFNGPDTVGVNGITYTGPAEITLVGKLVNGTLYESGTVVYPRPDSPDPAVVLRVNTAAVGPDLEESITINFGTFDADPRVTEAGDVRITDDGHRRVVWEF